MDEDECQDMDMDEHEVHKEARNKNDNTLSRKVAESRVEICSTSSKPLQAVNVNIVGI